MRRAASLALLALLTATACSTETDEGNLDLPERTCTVELADGSAAPGEWLALTASDWNGSATALLEDGDIDVASYVRKTEEGFDLLVPMHPNGIDGGIFQVTLLNDDRACEAARLSIEPIEPVPGAFRANAEAALELHEKVARRHGYTVEELQALVTGGRAVDGLTPLQFILAESQWRLDHPGNPASLVQLMDGLDAETQRQLDGAFAAAKLAEFSANYDPESLADQPFMGASSSTLTGAITRNDIQSPAQLAAAMEEASYWCTATDNVVEQVVLPLASAVSFAGPWGKALSAVLGAVSFARSKYAAFVCATHPVRIERIDVPTAAVVVDEEDKPEPTPIGGEWTVDAVTGPPVNVFMTIAEAGLVMLQLGEAAKAVKGAGAAAEAVESSAKASKTLMEKIDDGVDGVDVVNPGTVALGNKVIDKYVMVGGDDFPGIPGFNTDEWTLAEPASAVAEAIPCGSAFPDYCVRQLNVGESHIEFYPNPQIFKSLAPSPRDHVLVDVEMIEIELSERTMLFRESGRSSIQFEVKHAHDDGLRWTASNGGVVLDRESTTEESGTMGFTIDIDQLPTYVFVESTSEKAFGIRRNAFIVDAADIQLLGGPSCLRPGETYEFEAITTNGDSDIAWSATAGSIDRGGLFQAGATGRVTVVASSTIEGRTVEDDVTFDVDETCHCRKSYSSSGYLASSYADRYNFFTVLLPPELGLGIATIEATFTDGMKIQVQWNVSDGQLVEGRWPISGFTVLQDGEGLGGGFVGHVDVELEGDLVRIRSTLIGEFAPQQQAGVVHLNADSVVTYEGISPLQNTFCMTEENYERWRGD